MSIYIFLSFPYINCSGPAHPPLYAEHFFHCSPTLGFNSESFILEFSLIGHNSLLVRSNGEAKFLTKGDNNNVDDRGLYAPGQFWLQKKDVIGRAKGYLSLFRAH